MPPPVAPVQQPQQMQDAEPEERNSVTVPEPRTIMEALQQQHEELVKRHQDALSKGESSKARRLERLCKVSQLHPFVKQSIKFVHSNTRKPWMPHAKVARSITMSCQLSPVLHLFLFHHPVHRRPRQHRCLTLARLPLQRERHHHRPYLVHHPLSTIASFSRLRPYQQQ